jgi:hypothetical protein
MAIATDRLHAELRVSDVSHGYKSTSRGRRDTLHTGCVANTMISGPGTVPTPSCSDQNRK